MTAYTTMSAFKNMPQDARSCGSVSEMEGSSLMAPFAAGRMPGATDVAAGACAGGVCRVGAAGACSTGAGDRPCAAATPAERMSDAASAAKRLFRDKARPRFIIAMRRPPYRQAQGEPCRLTMKHEFVSQL